MTRDYERDRDDDHRGHDDHEKKKKKNPILAFPDGHERRALSPGDKGNRQLYVVAVLSNPTRSKARVKLFERFAQHIEDSGAVLYIVEQAFGDRPFQVTSCDNPQHLQVRSYFELWHKENMINLGIQILPKDWEYVAWIDGDVTFTRPDWVNETIEQLQHYMFVQMFSHAQDLSPRHEPMKLHTGFVYDWYHSHDFNPGGGYAEGHPGYAWAARREALDFVGGLMDFPILGSADRHMACALIGKARDSMNKELHPNYKKMVLEWEERAEKYIKRDVGYVAGLIHHGYHGPKSKRGYSSRWKILIDHKFNPLVDIYKDTQGLWVLNDDKPDFRDALRKYFRSRLEDDISEGNGKLQP